MGRVQKSALHVLDAARFARERAFECLWDCEEGTREVGIAAVDLALPGARERVAKVAADPNEGDQVVQAARRRLGM